MESKQVKARPVGVTRTGERLVFWRDDVDRVNCLRDKCPHRGVELNLWQNRISDDVRLVGAFVPVDVEYRRQREALIEAARQGSGNS